MGKIDYQKIYDLNHDDWKALTREPQKYEALLAGHYSDSNHFIYELLQNAEDENATKVVFEYYKDKLVFYHNGEPFDEADVRGVSSMLAGTKDRDEAQQIGRFGMGFKSVFKYTYQPEIYSDNEAFRIENYLLPVEMEDVWDYQTEKDKLCYTVNSGSQIYPFASGEHLTKIVIPYAKKDDEGNVIPVSGKDVLKKLEGLTGQILLFLSTVKGLYWVDKETGKYVMISLQKSKDDEQLLTCRMEGSHLGKKEEITRYLKYTKVFNHPKMKYAQVSVAYKVNNRVNNINEMPGTDIWVYFPTRDNTSLPFLIHGSFETAVSREKLMAPSDFNRDLFDKLGDLICESLLNLRERKLVTQGFIRRILIAAFKAEEENERIVGLKQKVTNLYKDERLLPDSDGTYRNSKELMLPVPFEISQFCSKNLFTKSFNGVKPFVLINNEKELNFTEYFSWLRDDLDVEVFHLSDWAEHFQYLKNKLIDTKGEDYNALEEYYDFLSNNRESLYNTKLSYTRSGIYERAIKQTISQAWSRLKKCPIIMNGNQRLVCAYLDDKPNIYLNASSKYKKIANSSIVYTAVASKFSRLLEDGLGLPPFDNFQFVKEKVVKKYIEIGETIDFDNDDNFENEYIEDIRQILSLVDESESSRLVADMVKDAYLIKIESEDEEDLFEMPMNTYIAISEEGIDLATYFAPFQDEDGNVEDFNLSHVDEEFYERNGIPIKKLAMLGIVTTPVREGDKCADGIGDRHWTALGEYCPFLSIEGLETNLDYIEMHSEHELARRKSAAILTLLLKISKKLRGTVRYRKNSPYEMEEEADILQDIRAAEWLIDKKQNLNQCISMSKYDLNTEIYGEITFSKDAYKTLGFIESADDNKVKIYEMVEQLDNRDQKIFLRNWARKLGMRIVEDDGYQEREDEVHNTKAEFNSDDWVSTEFPKNRIKSMDNLIEHVREQFYCADPTQYREVLRQIRVSKSPKTVRAYTMGMYTNDSNVCICQMCKQPSQLIDATEISNYGIEMSQLNLCLCPNCSRKYKLIRNHNKESFREQIKQAVKRIDIGIEVDEYELQINSEMSLFFTQTHVAELQTIFQLLEMYGITNRKHVNVELQQEIVNKSRFQIENSIREKVSVNNVVKEGSFIQYRKLDSGKSIEGTVYPDKYPLHRKFIGSRVGDIVEWHGVRYKVVSII